VPILADVLRWQTWGRFTVLHMLLNARAWVHFWL
jgi:hypothetical protein